MQFAFGFIGYINLYSVFVRFIAISFLTQPEFCAIATAFVVSLFVFYAIFKPSIFSVSILCLKNRDTHSQMPKSFASKLIDLVILLMSICGNGNTVFNQMQISIQLS